jgi:hypothetical protein
MADDVAVLEQSGQAVLIEVARDCRQPGCHDHAGWILTGDRVAVALCTEHAARRIRRRALAGRCAR